MCTIYVLHLPAQSSKTWWRGPLSERDVQNYLHVWGQAAFCGASLQPRLWGGRCRKKGFVVEGTSRVPFETGWRQRNQEFCVTKNGQSLHLLRKLHNGGGCNALLRHRNVTSFILHGVVCLWMGLVDKFLFKEKPLLQCWAALTLFHVGRMEITDSVAVHWFSRALSDGRCALQSDSCFLLCCNVHNLPQQGAMFHVSASIWYGSNDICCSIQSQDHLLILQGFKHGTYIFKMQEDLFPEYSHMRQ